jgi:beta-mannosidase
MEIGVPLMGATEIVDAKVPGSVLDALFENGIIPDPYFELNSRACEWVSDRFWVYRANFAFKRKSGRRYCVVFEGLDYKCDICFNGKHIASHENMYTPCSADVTDLLIENADNEISVMFYSAPDEMGQIGYTSKVFTQKARFYYKWDYCARLVNCGIYRLVYLEEYGVSVDNSYFRTDAADVSRFIYSFDVVSHERGVCEISAALSDEAGKSVFSESRAVSVSGGKTAVSFCGRIENPKLWYVRNEGAQPLYTLGLSIKTDGGEIFYKESKVGFKTLKMLHNEGAPPDAKPFLFNLNGRNVFMRGVNISPLDMLYGRITNERYDKLIADVAEMNANIIRVWGGGFIESEYFYGLCDKYGIFVWQDFIQSSSGLDNHPSDDDAFVAKFMDTVRCAVDVKRNHVSLAVFCGGNELAFGADRIPLDENWKILRLAGEYVRANSHIHFVATSSLGPTSFHDLADQSRNHDIHGPWLYFGDPEHYGYLNQAKCLFHSECGCNGMSGLPALRKFLSKKNLGKFNMRGNIVWRHHGESWDTSFRDEAVFGGNIKSLNDAITASRYLQAEGLKYIIECDRRDAFHCGGVMYWQFNELYPNVSGTNTVDYYGNRKPVYYQVKRCYNPLYVSIAYDKLRYAAGERCKVRPYVISDSDGNVEVSVRVKAGGRTLDVVSMSLMCERERAVYFNLPEFSVPDSDAVFFEMRAESPSGVFENSVMLLVKGKDGFCGLKPVKRYIAWLET